MVMPKVFEGNEPYIFISYAHKDSETVIPIIRKLQDRGFRVWYDAGIEAGSEWPAYIATHLTNCGCFIPFLTRNYMASDNCRQEIYFALRKKRALLPVYLEEVELDIGLEMQLSPIQALTLQKSMVIDALLQEMCKSAKLVPCMGKASAPAVKPAPAPQPAPKKPVPKPAAAPKNPTAAEYYQWGKQLYDKKRYADAVPFFRDAAQQGHAKAQYELAGCYRSGYGVSRDLEEAINWFQKAAQQGYKGAQSCLDACMAEHKLLRATPEECRKLGNQHLSNKEYAEAVKMFRRGAEQGNGECQYLLGNCYLNGWGLAKSLEEAVKCYKKAAELGCIDAQNKLADFYVQGTGVQKSYPEAIKWYKKAANQNSAQAQYALAWICFYGNDGTKDLESAINWAKKAAAQKYKESETMVEQWSASLAIQQMSPEECYKKAEALLAGKQFAEAFKWYEIAGEKGHMEAAFRTAEFMDGLTDDNGNTVVSQFIHEAERWYDKAAALGHPFAKKFAVSCCHEAAITKRTPEEWYQAGKRNSGENAEECYRKAARAGHLEAQRRLAQLGNTNSLLTSYTTHPAEVAYWCQRASAQQDPEAMCKTGFQYYESGKYNIALDLFRKAKKAGFPLGTFFLGCCYAEGKGVPQDCIHAWDLWLTLPDEHALDRLVQSYGKYYYDAGRRMTYQSFPGWYQSLIDQPGKYTKEQVHAWLEKTVTGSSNDLTLRALQDLAFAFNEASQYTPALILFRNIPKTYSQLYVGEYYIHGRGVEQDPAEAAKWFHLAADNPDQQNQFHPASPSVYACAWLCLLYKHGYGVKKSWLTAQKWKVECGNHKKRGRSRYGNTEETLKHFESELASAVTGIY